MPVTFPKSSEEAIGDFGSASAVANVSLNITKCGKVKGESQQIH